MPKQRITKDMVLEAAFRLLREGGEEQVLVKNIAASLSCSVQPIYSYCKSMEALRLELAKMSGTFIHEYISTRILKDAAFESTGKAYIAFAKEEPHLFRSYFLQNRSGIHSLEDLYTAEASSYMAAHLAKTLGISERRAKELHMNMIIYTTGLSFILISAGGSLSEEVLNKKLLDTYNIFLAAANNEEENKDESNRDL